MKKPPFWLLAVAFWLAYVVLLKTIPYLSPSEPALPNAAAAQGYGTSLAFLTLVMWTGLGLGMFAIFSNEKTFGKEDTYLAERPQSVVSWRRVEVALTFLVFCLLYSPPFLARYGHYIEDNYFMAILSRMECGQLPYRDFEFVYGPLMIYPLHFWTKLFGFTLQSYYGFLAIFQGALFATVIAVLQIYVPDRKRRIICLLLLLPMLFDTLLGLNWIGWRRILPVFALLMVAARPHDPRLLLAAGAVLGVQLAYSHEYGFAGLAAALSIYALLFVASRRWKDITAGAALSTVSVFVWLLLSLLLTGDTFFDYLTSTVHILVKAGELGLGQFAFYWTLHSMSLFALLAIAVLAVGSGIRRLRSESPAEGDRLILGALVFAIVSMKIALQRADIWHMSAPALALVFFFLLALPQRTFTLPKSWLKASWILIAVMSVTNLIGIMPTGSLYASGLARGAIDVMTGVPVAAPFPSRRYSVQSERTNSNQDYVAVAGFLASEEYSDRPVIFYGDRWWMGYHVGVCSSGYAIYDLMYTDDIQPMRDQLSAHPETLVVMSSTEYERLFEGAEVESAPIELSSTKRISSWTSTVHYTQSHIERDIKHRILREALGTYVADTYERTAQFGDEVILTRRSLENSEQGTGNE